MPAATNSEINILRLHDHAYLRKGQKHQHQDCEEPLRRQLQQRLPQLVQLLHRKLSRQSYCTPCWLLMTYYSNKMCVKDLNYLDLEIYFLFLCLCINRYIFSYVIHCTFTDSSSPCEALVGAWIAKQQVTDELSFSLLFDQNNVRFCWAQLLCSLVVSLDLWYIYMCMWPF